MKQIEITVKVNNTLKEVDNILSKQDFKIIRKGKVEDNYLLKENFKLNKRNILKALSNSVLIRYFKSTNREFQNITYKKKEYDKKTVLSEIKYCVDINDTNSARELFEQIGFEKLVDVKYDMTIYKKDNMELCLQDVENLGLLLEYENENDFSNSSPKEIIKEKKKMLKELSTVGLNISKDYDIKKAYELVKKELE